MIGFSCWELLRFYLLENLYSYCQSGLSNGNIYLETKLNLNRRTNGVRGFWNSKFYLKRLHLGDDLLGFIGSLYERIDFIPSVNTSTVSSLKSQIALWIYWYLKFSWFYPNKNAFCNERSKIWWVNYFTTLKEILKQYCVAYNVFDVELKCWLFTFFMSSFFIFIIIIIIESINF